MMRQNRDLFQLDIKFIYMFYCLLRLEHQEYIDISKADGNILIRWEEDSHSNKTINHEKSPNLVAETPLNGCE